MRHEFPVVLMLTVPDCEVTSWYRSDWTTRRYILRITLTCTLFKVTPILRIDINLVQSYSLINSVR